MNLDEFILKEAVIKSLEIIVKGYNAVKNNVNEYGYYTERRIYDANAKRFINMAKEHQREELTKLYEEKKEK